jgi:hypothetical protein
MVFAELSCLAIAVLMKAFLEVELFQDPELDIDNKLVEVLLVPEANEY